MTNESETSPKFNAETINRVKLLFGEGVIYGYALIQDDRLAEELKAQIKEPLSEEELIQAMQTSPTDAELAFSRLRPELAPAPKAEFNSETARALFDDLIRRVNIQRVYRRVLEDIEIAKVGCLICGKPSHWLRRTQLSGDHYYCTVHAQQEDDFAEMSALTSEGMA